MINKKRKVAVFDIDGTIFRSSLLIKLVERLVSRGVFPHTVHKTYAREQDAWLDRKGDYSQYIARVTDAFSLNIKGVEYSVVADIAGEIIEEMKGHTYRYTRDLAQNLKKKGYYMLAISRSPKFIVDGFGYELGFDKSYGIFFSTGASECFTGEIENKELIMNKGAILQRAVQRENLTLADSIAVGDTESDLPMLEIVETPIAFNPNEALYRTAKRNGWKIVVERKDVIYDCNVPRGFADT